MELLKSLKTRMVIQMLPPHRYDGLLTVNDSLKFEGKDLLTGGKFRFDMPLNYITDLRLGFDDTVVGRHSKGKKYQLNPVRIKYRNGDALLTMYIFMEYRGLFRSNSGEECYRIVMRLVNA
ncbi:MAG: hypothetical protein ACE5KA_02345 [Nitrososphaerales archaeon]